VAPPAEYVPPVQALDTLPLTRVVANDVREQGYEIQQLRVFVVVLAVFLLPLWIVAPFGLFRRNVAQPVPVVPLAPHEGQPHLPHCLLRRATRGVSFFVDPVRCPPACAATPTRNDLWPRKNPS
jgi:hypothetical protein